MTLDPAANSTPMLTLYVVDNPTATAYQDTTPVAHTPNLNMDPTDQNIPFIGDNPVAQT